MTSPDRRRERTATVADHIVKPAHLFTSNYATSGNDPRAVGISKSVPPWFTGKRDARLSPSRLQLQMKAADFRASYLAQLDALDPIKIAEELDGSVLLCFEPAGRFCHRNLVGNWLTNAGIIVKEIAQKKPSTR
jgi:hypothetical protein